MREGWALVAGGSGGLGAACCLALARAGMDVVVGYGRRAEAAETVAEAVRGEGRQAAIRAPAEHP